MLGSHFYNQIVRKNIIAFGTLFNNITMKSTDPDTGEVLETQKVPLAYGPKQKFLVRLTDQTSSKVAITLPRIYFEMTSIDYDSTRKTSPVQKYKTIIDGNGDEVRVQYVPVPYNIGFELGVIAKSQDDALQIVEQILPYFQPEWTTTVQLTEDPDVTLDIPLVLQSTSQDDVYEGGFEERRALIWSLDFTMKGFFFGPDYQQQIIKLANTQIYDTTFLDDITAAPTSNLEEAARITNQPGLLANNTPTT